MEDLKRGHWFPDEAVAALRRGPGLALWVVASVALSIVAWWFVRRELLRLPSDFLHEGGRRREAGSTGSTGSTGRLRRNAAGIGLILVGVLLLVLPGPGVLLIVVGLLTVELPWRDRFVRFLLRRRWALREVNAWRARRGEAPLRP